MIWKLFINGEGDSGVPLSWAAKRLAAAYEADEEPLRVKLWVIPEGGRQRLATETETRQLADEAARLIS